MILEKEGRREQGGKFTHFLPMVQYRLFEEKKLFKVQLGYFKFLNLKIPHSHDINERRIFFVEFMIEIRSFLLVDVSVVGL